MGKGQLQWCYYWPLKGFSTHGQLAKAQSMCGNRCWIFCVWLDHIRVSEKCASNKLQYMSCGNFLWIICKPAAVNAQPMSKGSAALVRLAWVIDAKACNLLLSWMLSSCCAAMSFPAKPKAQNEGLLNSDEHTVACHRGIRNYQMYLKGDKTVTCMHLDKDLLSPMKDEMLMLPLTEI